MDKIGTRSKLINRFANSYLYKRFYRALSKIHDSQPKGRITKIPKNSNAPVVILGMHRSGTTMLSKILRRKGIDFGWLKGNDTDESLFFQCLNAALFSYNSARWDQPDNLELALKDQSNVSSFASIFVEFSSRRKWTYSFLGSNTLLNASLFRINKPWGWKDPRTSYTLPIWLKLFPEAKIIFIYRNGIDVANSLYTRNLKMNLGSKTCSTLIGAFNLWEKYNQKCLKQLEEIPNSRVHSVRYEDLLQEPVKELTPLYKFLDLKFDDEESKNLRSQVLSQRAFAFKGKEELELLYDSVRKKSLMKQFGYSDL